MTRKMEKLFRFVNIIVSKNKINKINIAYKILHIKIFHLAFCTLDNCTEI